MSGRVHRHMAVWICLALCYAGTRTPLCRAADLQDVVARASATLKSDWAADPEYAYIERDEVQKDEQVTSKTSRVIYIDGSDYHLPLAIDDQPLGADREKELEKLKQEVRRRKTESPEARR